MVVYDEEDDADSKIVSGEIEGGSSHAYVLLSFQVVWICVWCDDSDLNFGGTIIVRVKCHVGE